MVQGIEIVRGRTLDIEIEITDANGNPYLYDYGRDLILFGVKKELTDETPLFCIEAIQKTAVIDGQYKVTIETWHTIDLAPGKYYYDVSIGTENNCYTIIEPSPFIIQGNVTKYGDDYD